MLKGTALVFAFTLLARIVGFAKEVMVAILIGAGSLSDALFGALYIAEVIRNVIGDGALTAAFVPAFADEAHEGHARAQRAFAAASTLLIAITGGMVVVGMIFTPTLVTVLSPGFAGNPETFDLCVRFTRIVLPYVLWGSIVTFLNGVLNLAQIYGVAAASKVYLNATQLIGAIVAFFAAAPSDRAMFLAVSLAIAGVVQVASQLRTVHRAGYRWRVSVDLGNPVVRSTLAQVVPATLGGSIVHLSMFITIFLASLLPEGTLSRIQYAHRVTEAPLGLLAGVLASVLLPTLSTAVAANDFAAFRRNSVDAMRVTSFVMTPVAILLYSFAQPLVALVYQRGSFDVESSIAVAQIVKASALGMWASALTSMVVRMFASLQRNDLVAKYGAVTVLLTVVFSVLLLGAPDEGARATVVGQLLAQLDAVTPEWMSLGYRALPLGSSVAAMVGLLLMLRRLSIQVQGFEWRRFLSSTTRTLCAAWITQGAVEFIGVDALPPATALGVGVPLAVAAFFGVSWMLRVPELNEIETLFRRGEKSETPR
jgi:putative peptidoglycan lipid II flippase